MVRHHHLHWPDDCDSAGRAHAQDRIAPRELVVDHPTLINPATSSGRCRRRRARSNAQVDRLATGVRARASGSRRAPAPAASGRCAFTTGELPWILVSPNMFARQHPRTWSRTPRYEARFVMSDPDGVAGPARRRHQDGDCLVRARKPAPHAGDASSTPTRPRSRVDRRPNWPSKGFLRVHYLPCGGGDTTTDDRAPGRQSRRHDSRARRRLRIPSRILWTDRSLNVTSPHEGTYHSRPSGTGGTPVSIAIKCRRRRRGRAGRQAPLQSDQRDAGQLGNHFEEPHASRIATSIAILGRSPIHRRPRRRLSVKEVSIRKRRGWVGLLELPRVQ